MKFENPEINKVEFETEQVANTVGGPVLEEIMGSQAAI